MECPSKKPTVRSRITGLSLQTQAASMPSEESEYLRQLFEAVDTAIVAKMEALPSAQMWNRRTSLFGRRGTISKLLRNCKTFRMNFETPLKMSKPRSRTLTVKSTVPTPALKRRASNFIRRMMSLCGYIRLKIQPINKPSSITPARSIFSDLSAKETATCSVQ